jgi:hypothetical protein
MLGKVDFDGSLEVCSESTRFSWSSQITWLITLNQRVQGSSPCAPTNKVNNLAQVRVGQSTHILQRILQFCSRFELHDGNFGELDVTAKVVRIEDRFDIPKAVAGERRDLRHSRVGKRQPYHC